MEYYSVIKKNKLLRNEIALKDLKIIMSHKRSQTTKSTWSVISFI